MRGHLIVKGICGLGDRLLSLAVALLYAKLSGRSVYVDWRDEFFGNKGENLFEDLFELRGIPWRAPVDQTASVVPPVWRGCLHLSLPELLRSHGMLDRWDRNAFIRLCSVDIRELNHLDVNAVYCLESDISKLRPHLMASDRDLSALSDAELLRHILTTHLALRPALQSAVDSFVGERFRSPMVGIHVRKTNECGPRYFEPRRYHEAIAQIRKRQPDAGLFIATDNSDVLREFITKYPMAVHRQKWFDIAGQPLHGNRSACPNPRANVEDAAIEMWVLSRCDYLVVPGNSGFSNVASLLSNARLARQTRLDRATGALHLVRRWMSR